MATYTVKVLNRTEVIMKSSVHVTEPHISIPFLVESLGLSGNVTLLKEGFTVTKAKAAIKEKIKEHLAKLAEHMEYDVTI
jgi:hypothetical protein